MAKKENESQENEVIEKPIEKKAEQEIKKDIPNHAFYRG